MTGTGHSTLIPDHRPHLGLDAVQHRLGLFGRLRGASCRSMRRQRGTRCPTVAHLQLAGACMLRSLLVCIFHLRSCSSCKYISGHARRRPIQTCSCSIRIIKQNAMTCRNQEIPLGRAPKHSDGGAAQAKQNPIITCTGALLDEDKMQS